MRVCDTCYKRIENLNPLASIDKSKDCSINNLLHIKDHSEDNLQRQWAIYELSRFRELQYNLPDHVFCEEERLLLWSNRYEILGHNNLFLQLLLSFDYQRATKEQSIDMESLLNKAWIIPTKKDDDKCWKMMCSRTCSPHFTKDHVVQILQHNVRFNPVRDFAIK